MGQGLVQRKLLMSWQPKTDLREALGRDRPFWVMRTFLSVKLEY